MRTSTGSTVIGGTILALAALGSSTPVAAQSVAEFYRGKTIRMVVATSPGGDYDLRARLLTRHMGRHIPGEPSIVAVNMPGAVGVQAANWMAAQAPQDGTALHAIMQGMSALQALGGGNVEFDTRTFSWIGNTTDTPNVINSWYTTGIKTIQDVMTKELVVGAPGLATSSVYYPKALNELVGTKFKIVPDTFGGTSPWSVARLGAADRTPGHPGNRRIRNGSRTRRFLSWSRSQCDAIRNLRMFRP